MLGWLIYGLIVGALARYFHPGDEPDGCLVTIGIGVAGALVGGGINWVLRGGGPYSASGAFMGVIGGVLFLYGYDYYLNNWKK